MSLEAAIAENTAQLARLAALLESIKITNVVQMPKGAADAALDAIKTVVETPTAATAKTTSKNKATPAASAPPAEKPAAAPTPTPAPAAPQASPPGLLTHADVKALVVKALKTKGDAPTRKALNDLGIESFTSQTDPALLPKVKAAMEALLK